MKPPKIRLQLPDGDLASAVVGGEETVPSGAAGRSFEPDMSQLVRKEMARFRNPLGGGDLRSTIR